MDGSYTSKIEHDMWDLSYALEETYDIKEVIEYLKGEKFHTLYLFGKFFEKNESSAKVPYMLSVYM